MAVDTYTTGKLGLIEPARGGYVDTWDTPLYANWQTLEAAVSGTTTITLSNSNVVLVVPTYPTNANPPSVTNSAQNLRLLLNGALANNVTIFIPSTVGGFWIVDNQTTGTATVTIKTTASGSTGIVARRGYASILYSDGTNINYADMGSIRDGIDLYVPSSVPVGAVMPFAGSTVPNSNWLACNGSAVSRTTYASLFAYIGTTYGTGDGASTFNVPNYNSGAFLRGTGGNALALGALQTDQLGSHTHTITDPGHFHNPVDGVTAVLYAVGPGGNPTYYAGGSGGNTNGTNNVLTNTKTTGITIAAFGGNETRPVNYSVFYCIRAL